MTTRFVISVAMAAAIGATAGGATLANASGTSTPPTPAPAGSPAPVKALTTDPVIAHAAALLGVTPDQLLHALGAVKRASVGQPLSNAGAAAVLAGQLHVTTARAQQALSYLFGAVRADKSPTGPAPASALSSLATQLGVTVPRAQWVLDQLDAIARPGQGVDPNSAAFARLATALGKTPAQLESALRQWKQSLTIPAASPSPPATTSASPSPSPS